MTSSAAQLDKQIRCLTGSLAGRKINSAFFLAIYIYRSTVLYCRTVNERCAGYVITRARLLYDRPEDLARRRCRNRSEKDAMIRERSREGTAVTIAVTSDRELAKELTRSKKCLGY